MITVITCETGCGQTIAAFHDADEAHEVAAYETGHYCSEAGYSCTACYDEYWQEAMRDAMAYMPIYRAELALRDRQAAEDDRLAMADSIFDAARDRGEI